MGRCEQFDASRHQRSQGCDSDLNRKSDGEKPQATVLDQVMVPVVQRVSVCDPFGDLQPAERTHLENGEDRES